MKKTDKLIRAVAMLSIAGLIMSSFGCSSSRTADTPQKEEQQQEGESVAGKLSRTVTYEDTNLIIDGNILDLTKADSSLDIKQIESVKRLNSDLVAVEASMEDGNTFFTFVDIQGMVFMNREIGQFFYWYKDQMDSLVYFSNGNICNAQENELLNINNIGDEIISMEYDSTDPELLTVIVKAKENEKEISLKIRNSWQDKTEE